MLLKALIAEDNPNDAELLIIALQRGDFEVEMRRVDTPQDFEAALDSEQWDIIFSDHSMPYFSSFQALEIRNNKSIDTPFIILSGIMGEDLAVEAIKAGASDYFVKGKLQRLTSAIQRELKEVEDRESRRQAEWELGRFVASLTHDLKTPLLAEYRILEILKSGACGGLNPEQEEIVKELIISNQYAQHMVNNILFAYKYKENKIQLSLEKTNLLDFVNLLLNSISIRSLMAEKSHNLVLELPESLPVVDMDPTEMQRVMLNLLKNAMDYTPENGTIKVAVEKLNNNKIRVSISDTGPGVDPKIEPYLFSPYTSASKSYRKIGIGLGLYLSKQIIEAHEGQIGYQKIQSGSKFYFDLPIVLPLIEVAHSETTKKYQAV